jgi:hypothetical protein
MARKKSKSWAQDIGESVTKDIEQTQAGLMLGIHGTYHLGDVTVIVSIKKDEGA